MTGFTATFDGDLFTDPDQREAAIKTRRQQVAADRHSPLLRVGTGMVAKNPRRLSGWPKATLSDVEKHHLGKTYTIDGRRLHVTSRHPSPTHMWALDLDSQTFTDVTTRRLDDAAKATTQQDQTVAA